tara:strand:+ start:989 stop:1147 length:159 start_codon:yes stop_codon:yes gene_type:complete
MGILNYFSAKEKLKREYKKLLELSFKNSTVDRKLSDKYYSEAQEILLKIEKM